MQLAVRRGGLFYLESWWAVPDVGDCRGDGAGVVVSSRDVWAAGGGMQAQAFTKSLVGTWCRRVATVRGKARTKDSVIAGCAGVVGSNGWRPGEAVDRHRLVESREQYGGEAGNTMPLGDLRADVTAAADGEIVITTPRLGRHAAHGQWTGQEGQEGMDGRGMDGGIGGRKERTNGMTDMESDN